MDERTIWDEIMTVQVYKPKEAGQGLMRRNRESRWSGTLTQKREYPECSWSDNKINMYSKRIRKIASE